MKAPTPAPWTLLTVKHNSAAEVMVAFNDMCVDNGPRNFDMTHIVANEPDGEVVTVCTLGNGPKALVNGAAIIEASGRLARLEAAVAPILHRPAGDEQRRREIARLANELNNLVNDVTHAGSGATEKGWRMIQDVAARIVDCDVPEIRDRFDALRGAMRPSKVEPDGSGPA